ncbi:gliding motility-associated C-terminal domain-containing protein [Pedobacter sp. KLB.chiD]|uniref:gliding motility-associated C-terminal domain-containing protein n=1 Tax=Pedobacter sp. KLB.chiD TaxID=3387402 RepID=UPI00399B203B
MKRIIVCVVLGIALLWYTRASAQDNLPFTLNSAGGYGSSGGQLFDFNFGEMVLVNTFSTGPYLLSQGFLQPYLLNTSSVTDVTVVNNVITPNGDGKNDVLLIQGLERYPGSKLSIYDRAGRKIYSATDYQNNWNAMIDGKPLNEDTYYYVINLGKGWGLLRGFISVILDNK